MIHQKKEILIYFSGGACGSEYRTYKKISSKWKVIKRIVYNQDDWDKGDKNCYESTYEVDDNLELELINRIRVHWKLNYENTLLPTM